MEIIDEEELKDFKLLLIEHGVHPKNTIEIVRDAIERVKHFGGQSVIKELKEMTNNKPSDSAEHDVFIALEEIGDEKLKKFATLY